MFVSLKTLMNLNLIQIQFQLIFYNTLAIPSALRSCEVRIQKQKLYNKL
jgi:hypothetical protein